MSSRPHDSPITGRKGPRPVIGVLVGALLMMLTGCGDQSAGTRQSGAATQPGTTLTITHAMGRTSVPTDVQRVVALEWVYVEDLLALGVEPVGVVDPAGYRKWVSAGPELPADVQSVGGRQEPSLERIAQLEPDLIIATRVNHERIYGMLSHIAPTLMFDSYDLPEGVTQLERMQQTARAIGRAVGRESRAEALLRQLQSQLVRARRSMQHLSPPQRRFVLAQTFTQQNAPVLRLFTDNAMAVQMLERMGLENAWAAPNQTYGFSTVSVEALTEVGDANLFYVAQTDDDVLAERFNDHPIWQHLEFVQSDRLFALGGDTNFFGGPLSARQLIDQVSAAMHKRYGAAPPSTNTTQP